MVVKAAMLEICKLLLHGRARAPLTLVRSSNHNMAKVKKKLHRTTIRTTGFKVLSKCDTFFVASQK